MLKKLALLLAVLFLVTSIGPAFAQTEDEIVAKFLQKTEKKHKTKVGYISAHFNYGILTKDVGYGSFNYTGSSDLATLDGGLYPHFNIFRSNELGIKLGMMLTPKASLNIGFDYWFEMGTDYTIDQNATFGVLEVGDSYVNNSGIKIYGVKAGFDYYFLNNPDRLGQLNSLALKVGGGAGYYSSSWDVWREEDTSTDPLKASAPGMWVQGGAEYPLGFFDMVIGADVCYFYLNFSDVKSYNEDSGTLTLSYRADDSDMELNFSGLRGKVELKKFIVW